MYAVTSTVYSRSNASSGSFTLRCSATCIAAVSVGYSTSNSSVSIANSTLYVASCNATATGSGGCSGSSVGGIGLGASPSTTLDAVGMYIGKSNATAVSYITARVSAERQLAYQTQLGSVTLSSMSNPLT